MRQCRTVLRNDLRLLTADGTGGTFQERVFQDTHVSIKNPTLAFHGILHHYVSRITVNHVCLSVDAGFSCRTQQL